MRWSLKHFIMICENSHLIEACNTVEIKANVAVICTFHNPNAIGWFLHRLFRI